MRRRKTSQEQRADALPVGGGDGLSYVQCPACSLNLSEGTVRQAGGACTRCGEPIKVAATTAPLPASKPAEVPAPARLNLPKVGDEYAISPLVARLVELGYSYSLDEVARWTSTVQTLVGRHLEGDPAVGKPAVLVDDEQRQARARLATGLEANGQLPSPPPRQALATDLAPVATFEAVTADGVRYEWAEEALQLADFCTVRVGPFSATTSVRAGETPESALQRLKDKVDAFAERERARKITSFLAALRGARQEAKSASAAKP